MKTILVHSGISGIGFDSWGKGDLTESTWINHGLCLISARAKQKGFSVELIDLRLLKGWTDFAARITACKPTVIGFSMMSVDYNYVMRCIEITKEISKDIKTVVGGPHPSIMPEELAANPKIDYIVRGEGELTFTELLESLKNGKEEFPRIISGAKPDLDAIPFADRDLYQREELPVIKEFRTPFVSIITSRGCVYNCSFCQPAERLIFGRKVRQRSVDNVIEELKCLKKRYGFKTLMVHDDSFTLNKHWVEEFCNKYQENKFAAPFICQSRADFICNNEKLFEKMRDTGLKMVIIGFESGNQRILDFLRKNASVEQNYEAARTCKRLGVKIWANYMLGIPTETKKEAMDTVRMIKEIRPNHASPAFFTPHPGSDLFEYCQVNKLSLVSTHEDYRRNPKGEKIIGVDYDFLNKALQESVGYETPATRAIFRKNNKLYRYSVKQLKKHYLTRKLIEIIKGR